MDEPRWPDEVPPPFAPLYQLGEHCLNEVNFVARTHPPSTALEHQLLEILRTQAIAIGALSEQLLLLRQYVWDSIKEGD